MILLSFFVLRQSITSVQALGLLFTVITVYLLTSNIPSDRKLSLARVGIVLTIISAIFAALANLTVNFTSNRVGTFAFTFTAYGIGFLFSSLVNKLKLDKSSVLENQRGDTKEVYILGTAIGFFNFLGLVFFIEALKTGTFSIVGAINNFSLLLTLGLSILIYTERPTVKQIMGIILAFISLFLFNM